MSKRSHESETNLREELPGTSLESSLASCSKDQNNYSIAPPNKRVKKRVSFKDVTVFYFTRAQGFICVPSQGGSSLGMSSHHILTKKFTIQEHLEEKRKSHLEMIKEKRKSEMERIGEKRKHLVIGNNNPIHPDCSNGSESEESEAMSEDSEDELEADYMFLQPLLLRQRRELLRESGVRKIDSHEKEDCQIIRTSREFCGCSCGVFCYPDTCDCSLAGIKCQVDRSSFPCGCSTDGCQNLTGRVEFDAYRVHSHFVRTIMRLKLEAEENQEERYELDGPFPLQRPSTSKNGGNFSLDCNSLLQSAFLKKAVNSLKSAGAKSLLKENAQALLFSLKDKKLLSAATNLDMYKSQFSPEDSSYSESSDYNSDEVVVVDSHKPREKVVPGSSGLMTDNSSCLQDSFDSNQLDDDDDESTLIANEISFSSSCSSQSISNNDDKMDDVSDVIDILLVKGSMDKEVVLS